jgi:hypothetical protein
MNRIDSNIIFYSFNDGALDVVLPVIFLIQKTRWDENKLPNCSFFAFCYILSVMTKLLLLLPDHLGSGYQNPA